MTTLPFWRRPLVGAALLTLALPTLIVSGAAQAQTEYEKLIAASQAELAATGGKLNIALDWPDVDAGPVMEAFKAEFPWVTEITYTRETGVGQFGRLLIEIQQGIQPPYDIMHIASEFEEQYWADGAFVQPPFDYAAINESLPADWPKIHESTLDPDGRYIGTTSNIRGIAWNPNLVPESALPLTWASCADPQWKGQVIYDARNKGQAFQFDETTRPAYLEWLAALRDNEAVADRGQARVLQAVAAGEYAIACMVNHHTARRMIEVEGVTTLGFGLAETIPLEFGTRLFVLKGSRTPATVQLFAVWAVTKGQAVLDQAAYRGFPWIPGTRLYDDSQGKYIALCGADCAARFEEFNAEYISILGFPAALAED